MRGAKKRAWLVLAAVAACGAVAARRGGAAAPGVPLQRQLTEGVKYVFEPVVGERRITHDTAVLTLRNRAKLRPLFVTGRGQAGSLEVVFEDVGDMQGLVDSGDVAELLDYGKTRGKARIAFEEYSASLPDADRTAGADWVKADAPPELVLTIKAVRGWAPQTPKPEGGDGADEEGASRRYGVKIQATLAAGERTAAIEAPGEATLAAPGAGKGGEAGRMILRGTFTFQGADLGLTGGDAGEMAGTFEAVGLRAYAPAEAEELGEAMSVPSLDEMDEDW